MSGAPARRAVPGLDSPLPFGDRLPLLYSDDDFARRMVAAFDEVLAPVLSCLDCLPAYFDPFLAPEDFVDWLGGWLAADLPRGLPAARRRELVAGAVGRHGLRGTARGLAEQIRLVFGVEAVIADSGGTTWSPTPGGTFEEPNPPIPTVVVWTNDPTTVPEWKLRALVDAYRPAHVPCVVGVAIQPGEDPEDAEDAEDNPGPDQQERRD
ncbi:phage tail protein [Streptomyces graminilatus]|uniref:phage tail protein n=1 Tax=Streptomyces graminilatus TaxID=1464070 RepID=UPI0007C81AA9|nr:phage tail protein [Streptomyces graminilatus]